MDGSTQDLTAETAATSQTEDEELRGYYVEELSVGMTAIYSKTVSESDIVMFAGISGDTNPIHLNHDFASRSPFEGPIAHGMLTASFISAVLGNKLPGPGCVYISQDLRFKAPVRIGDTVVARATIAAIDLERQRVTVRTICTVGETVVLTGEALLLVPSKANGSAA